MFEIKIGKIDHMLPHVPTQGMIDNHNWHVYRTDNPRLTGSLAICFTGTRQECREWIERRQSLERA